MNKMGIYLKRDGQLQTQTFNIAFTDFSRSENERLVPLIFQGGLSLF